MVKITDKAIITDQAIMTRFTDETIFTTALWFLKAVFTDKTEQTSDNELTESRPHLSLNVEVTKKFALYPKTFLPWLKNQSPAQNFWGQTKEEVPWEKTREQKLSITSLN